MSARDYVGQAGIVSGVWIDGEYISVGPKTWNVAAPARQAIFEAMNGTHTVTAAYDGDGLPIVLDTFSFEFPFDLDVNFSDLTVALETLRTAGGVHTLAIQKAFMYAYRLRAGQATFWIRGDAAAQGFEGFESADFTTHISIPSSAVPAPTVIYKPTVSVGDSVPANEAWISATATQHPQSGKFLAFCKLGTVPSAPAQMTVAQFPLFRVVVTAVPRIYPVTGMETSTLICSETN